VDEPAILPGEPGKRKWGIPDAFWEEVQFVRKDLVVVVVEEDNGMVVHDIATNCKAARPPGLEKCHNLEGGGVWRAGKREKPKERETQFRCHGQQGEAKWGKGWTHIVDAGGEVEPWGIKSFLVDGALVFLESARSGRGRVGADVGIQALQLFVIGGVEGRGGGGSGKRLCEGWHLNMVCVRGIGARWYQLVAVVRVKLVEVAKRRVGVYGVVLQGHRV
jgi:hypothetical protein